MNRRTLGWAVAVVLTWASSAQAAGLADAQDLFLHGKYDEAADAAAKLKGKEADAAAVLIGRVQLRTGKLKEAEATLRKAGKAKGAPGIDARTTLGEVLRAEGSLTDARKELEAVVAKEPTAYRARAMLGEVYLGIGELKLASDTFDQFYTDFNASKIDDKNAEQMMYVAMAAQYLGNFQEASDTFRTAVDLDKNLLEANVRWGNLFMEKYSVGYAEPSFEEVLKIDPNQPDALAGMARVKLEQTYDVKAATDLCDKALKVSPNNPGALEVKAEMLIDNAEYPAALAVLQKAFSVNPNELHGRALEATIAYLKDDKPAYQAAIKKILAVNPKYADVYHVVATFAVKEHRYVEAIGLEQEAIKLRPDFYVAMAELASNYLRMGDEVKGRELLDKAFSGDGFNVRAYNLLNLYEDVIDKDYEFATWPVGAKTPLFRFRMTKDERPMLLPHVAPMLTRAWNDMVKRYGFTPKGPVTIELFADSDHYSVRTVGLPNLGALGVCFGQVITALSPKGRSINWGMVLWHELGHVFAIQLSNSRVPRWFTEGLSEYETIIARREWRRENDRDLWMALKDGTLPGVLDLNAAFTRAQDINDVVVAYHQSSVMVTWMAQKFGFPKIVEALKLFGQDKDLATVLKSITGMDIPTFDAEFRKYLAVRLAAYDGSYVVNLAKYGDLEAREKAAKAAPKDLTAQAALAIAYEQADELDKADAIAQEVLKVDPKRKEALWVAADVALKNRKEPEAKKLLEQLIAAGGDGYDPRGKLGLIASHDKNLMEAEKQLGLAKKKNPEASEPYELLYQLYNDRKMDDKATAELEAYAWIEQMDSKAYSMLVERHFAKKNWAKVATFGEIAIDITPYDGKVLEKVGRAYNEVGRTDEAITELSAALLAKDDDVAEHPALIHLELAKAWLAKKDKTRAKTEFAAAVKLDPKDPDIAAFRAKLK